MTPRVEIPHNGMLFPARYSMDPPEPREPDLCPRCDAVLDADGDKYDWEVRCTADDCDFSQHGGLL